eukprot:TRINITY_DN23278_c0_g1_i1.p1 TRINITY_DN23278_c0_g1~~TRINITY_DN23278_c0_g1_i1.p1  ORF type:complete len:230 (+),score=-1.36 TRINITY_DN23278_c0_g1_i1:118-807(+)
MCIRDRFNAEYMGSGTASNSGPKRLMSSTIPTGASPGLTPTSAPSSARSSPRATHGACSSHCAISSNVPRWVLAVLRALRLQDPSFALLQHLDDREWERVLSFCDGAGLTLVLGAMARDSMPGWVRDRIERDLANNTQRHERAKAVLFDIQEWLAVEGISPLVLKGFTQAPAFIPDPALRPQYDIDLYCPLADVLRARDLLLAHGYEPLLELEDFPTDHLPVMIPCTLR